MSAEKLSATMPFSQPKRRFNWRKAVVFVLTAIIVYRLTLILFTSTHPHPAHLVESTGNAYSQLYHDSWRNLAHTLQESKPLVSSIGTLTPVPGVSVEDAERTAHEAVDALEASAEDVTTLQKSHQSFIDAMNARKMSVIYQRGQQGIVVTAGSDDLPNILVQIRLLRRTGSKLPVEVFFLNQDDYDDKICKTTLRKLKVQCKIIEEEIDASPLPTMPRTRRARQMNANEPLHKLLAVFFSQYEEVLLLDPATLVFNNPDSIYREEPFLSTGLIIWPDFWASTVSNKLFTVQGAQVEKHNRRDNIRTVDMGQFLISKSQQSASLLLSIYYTYFGENLYDSLLQQSKAGEKGSQSIKSAARYLDAPYYMIKRNVEAVGFPDMDSTDHGFKGVAMQQSFPSDDYHRVPKSRQRPLFIRANEPKLNAAKIMDAGVTSFRTPSVGAATAAALAAASSTATVPSGSLKKVKAVRTTKPHRMWEWFDARDASNGWRDPDPERAMWEEVWRVACEDSKNFSSWSQDETETRSTCQSIAQHREALGWKEFFVL